MHEQGLLGLILAGGVVIGGCGESIRHEHGPTGAGGFGVAGAPSLASGGQANTTGGHAGNGASGVGTGASGAGNSAGTGASGAGSSAGIGGAGVAGNRGNSSDVTVNLDEPVQTMDGFGINDTFASAFTDAEAAQLFDPKTGIGLSILGVAMSSTGGETGADTWSDIRMAKALGVDTFFATTWSAPASCKNNRNEDDGGYLEDSCYATWSDTLAAFAALVKTNTGVDLYGISPQHEPDFASCGTSSPCNGDFPSMLFTADEMVAFVNVLGPKLHALNPPVKLLGPDTREWNRLWTNQSAQGATDPLNGAGYDYGHALFNDSGAWSLVDGLTTHQYDSQVAEPWPSDVPRSKPIWMTEMSGAKFWPEQGPSNDIDNGIAVAGWIHDAITNGPASAWMYFWRRAENTDDNEGLILKDGTSTKRLYTFGNFSRFVRPGYTHVAITGNVPATLLLTGYLGPDGTVVVVAINKGSDAVTTPLFVAGGATPSTFAPYVTSATDDLAAKVTVPVSGGAFMATLPSMTVTTFVGKP